MTTDTTVHSFDDNFPLPAGIEHDSWYLMVPEEAMMTGGDPVFTFYKMYSKDQCLKAKTIADRLIWFESGGSSKSEIFASSGGVGDKGCGGGCGYCPNGCENDPHRGMSSNFEGCIVFTKSAQDLRVRLSECKMDISTHF